MEHSSANLSVSQLLTSMRAFRSGGLDVTTVWRFIIATFLLGMLGVGVTAYLTYAWVTSDDVPNTPLIGSRDTQTIAELKELVGVYLQKEKDYLFLLAAEPEAPVSVRGQGMEVPASLRFEEEVAQPASTTEQGGGIPPSMTASTSVPTIIN